MMEQQSDTSASRPATDNASGENLPVSFVAILFFVLCIAAAATLVIAAAVIWLGEILDSVALSALIFGGAAAVAALVIYLASVRRSVRILHDYLETVYDTSRMAKSGYEQVKSWFTLIFK